MSESLQKSNIEFAAKVDNQRLENETKLSFLLQQLRQAEDRLKGFGVHNDSNLRMSIKSAAGSINNGMSTGRPSTAGAISAWTEASSPQISIGKPSLNNLGAINVKDSSEDKKGSLNSKNDLSSTEDDLKRKWYAEKQRREQLEKRNVELTRELRSIKASANS